MKKKYAFLASIAALSLSLVSCQVDRPGTGSIDSSSSSDKPSVSLPDNDSSGSSESADSSVTSPAYEDVGLKIVTLSDLHVLPRYMIADTADFAKAQSSDRKLLTESQAIFERRLAEVEKQSPDVLLITGDLTKDGEKESHEYVASQLESLKERMKAKGKDLKICIVPGNHDINNQDAYDYNPGSTAENILDPAYDTAAQKTANVTPEEFMEIYGEAVYEQAGVERFIDSDIYKTESAPTGAKAGYESYAIRLSGDDDTPGVTLLALDSARYSADNTDSGLDAAEASGNIGSALRKWIDQVAAEAHQRGDAVIAMMHHGVQPHFDNETDLLPQYIVNEYTTVRTLLLKNDIHYVFTGHMHANDISTATLPNYGSFYDIETGSNVTYPCPMRVVDLTYSPSDEEDGELSLDISTEYLDSEALQNDPIEFPSLSDPKTMSQITDLVKYSESTGLTENLVDHYLSSAQSAFKDTIRGSTGDRTFQQWVESDDDGGLGTLTGGISPAPATVVDTILQALLPTVKASLPIVLGDFETSSITMKNLTVTNIEQGADKALNVRLQADISLLGGVKNIVVTIPHSSLQQFVVDFESYIDDSLVEGKAEEGEKTAWERISDIVHTELVNKKMDDEGHTLLQFLNALYQTHLYGDENTNLPSWARSLADSFAAGSQSEGMKGVYRMISAALGQILGVVLEGIPFTEQFTSGITTSNTLATSVLRGVLTGKTLGSLLGDNLSSLTSSVSDAAYDLLLNGSDNQIVNLALNLVCSMVGFDSLEAIKSLITDTVSSLANDDDAFSDNEASLTVSVDPVNL